jgi:hypothetical protein
VGLRRSGRRRAAPAQPPAQLRTEGNNEYGRIDAKMFRRSAQVTAKDYDAAAAKVSGKSALYGAITQMSPLSLAVRPSPFQRAMTFFQRRLWGEASVGDALARASLSGDARRRGGRSSRQCRCSTGPICLAICRWPTH